MKSQNLRTPQEIRAEFAWKGVSIRGWAKKHGISPAVVTGLLNGRLAGRIGQSHKAAVLLGLKDGEIVAENGDA